MTSPKVTFEELIDGQRPVRPRNLNRVGSIGTCRKGKFGAAILLASDDDLDRKIGRTTDTGSVGVQTARDEGATDQVHVRVLGAGRFATFTVTITGTGTVADTYTLVVTKSAVNYTYVANLTVSETAESIIAELVALINADSNSPVTAVQDPTDDNRLILTAKLAGIAGNSITFTLTEGSEVADDLAQTAASGTLAGGAEAPKQAEAVLAPSATKLVAIGEGVDGNSISYAWVPGLKARTVELTVTDSSVSPAYKETFLLDYSTAASLINTNEFAILRSSTLIRGYYTGTDITTQTLPTGSGSLASGADGPAILDIDYVTAARILAKAQANVIFAPGQTGSIRNVLMAQAENATILDGLRVAVINAPARLDPATASTATTGFDTTTGSAVMVAGWCTYAGQPALPEYSVSPDGFYAGHLAATPTHVSPAARSSSPYFRTVVDVDTERTEQAYDQYTNAKLEAIVLDLATNGFHCLNGRTLASDSAEYYVCIRRMANQIKTDLYFASQAIKSEPKTDNLVASIQGMVTGYMEGLANAGKIKGGSVSGVKKTATGLRVDFQWYPIYPADTIEYGMHRLAVDV